MAPASGVAAPTRIPVLIADDEAPARLGLRTMLERHADVQVVGEARSGLEAIGAIESLRPELVFLDVQMPDGDGFEVIRQVGAERMPVVIFSTAFDEHALRAFEAHALDYLLKPYDQLRFDAALDKARERLQRRAIDERLLHFLERVDERTRFLQRIVVRHGARTQFVPVSQVDYLEADANYVRVWSGDKHWLVRDTLSNLERQLDPTRFLRIHRSLVVHVTRIVELESLFAGEYVISLSTGKKLTSGRTYRAAIQAALGV
jgi:two-component system, LytTR family, response regulator